MLANASGLGTFLCASKVLLKDFSAWSQALSARIREGCESVMREAGRPLLFVAKASTSKEELADSIRVRDGITAGSSTTSRDRS